MNTRPTQPNHNKATVNHPWMISEYMLYTTRRLSVMPGYWSQATG